MVVRRCPTLPRPRGRSTIGAEGLSFRVRDGTGRFPPRYDRRNSMEMCTPGPPCAPLVVWGVGVVVCRYLKNRTVDALAGFCFLFPCHRGWWGVVKSSAY